jgi:hypothetical protein
MCAFLLPHALLLSPRVPILSVLAVLASLFFSYFPYLVMSSFHVLSDDDIFLQVWTLLWQHPVFCC